MRIQHFVVGFALLLFASGAPIVGSAQPVQFRGDVLITLGGGSSFGAVNCFFCAERGLPAYTYRVAYALQTDVAIGIEGAWTGARLEGPCSKGCSSSTPREPEEARFRVSTHTLIVQAYPYSELPILVKFGVGVASHRVGYATERNGDRAPVRTVRKRRRLYNFKAGAGVERQIASRFSLSVHVDASYAMNGRLKAADAALSGAFVYAGMALTWRAW